MKASETINELAAALAKAQGAIKGAVKDSANPFFKSKYADLASVWDACRKPLADNGLSVVQFPRLANGMVEVTTMLMHSSGQFLSDDLNAEPKDTSPQGIGSTITYLRRYALAAVAGVAPEEDDGEAAQGRTQQAPAYGAYPQRQERQAPPQSRPQSSAASRPLQQNNRPEPPPINSTAKDEDLKF
jgi:hypothetical protein